MTGAPSSPDIIERLRDATVVKSSGFLPSRKLYSEAADEIEALRHDVDRYAAISTELADENERLRAPAQASPTGFDKAEGYIASLRQMAACNFVDFDELTDIADFMEGSSVSSTERNTADPICLVCNRNLSQHSLNTADVCNSFIGGDQ